MAVLRCERCAGITVRDNGLDGLVRKCLACGHEMPVPESERGGPPQPGRAERVATVQRLTAQGYSDAQIAQETGIPVGSIWGLRKAGEQQTNPETAPAPAPGRVARVEEGTRVSLPTPPKTNWIDQAREECERLVRDVEAVNGKRRRAEQIVAALKAMGAEAPVLPWRGGKAAEKQDGAA